MESSAAPIPLPPPPAAQDWGRVGIFTLGLWRLPGLDRLLGVRHLRLAPTSAEARDLDAVAVWGLRRAGAAGRAYAARHGLPCLTLEDGLLRSVGLGVAGARPWSILCDLLGAPYDARIATALEREIQALALAADPELRARAEALIARIRSLGLDKYAGPSTLPGLPGEPDRPRILVVDQTAGDLAIRTGLADARSFRVMLEAAIAENPDAEILLKTHPDVLAGRRQGHVPPDLRLPPRVHRLTAPANPLRLAAAVSQVHVVTSGLGWEALLAGAEVQCWGAPWYAGWGLTRDRGLIPARRLQGPRPLLADLAAAAFFRIGRHLDPLSGERATAETLVEGLGAVRDGVAAAAQPAPASARLSPADWLRLGAARLSVSAKLR